MKRKIVIFIDDDASLVVTIANNVLKEVMERDLPYDFRVFTDPDGAVAALHEIPKGDLAAVVVDLWMENHTTGEENKRAGILVLEQVQELQPQSRKIVLSAHVNSDIDRELK